MTLVVLASGGLDSTLVSVLAAKEGIDTRPIFIDYGQLAARTEWETCKRVYAELRLPKPTRMSIAGYGKLIPSGLTNSARRIREDAFLPGRNLLLLVAAAGVAYSIGAKTVAIGLLCEADHLFPDQTAGFLEKAESLIAIAHGRPTTIVAPLIEMSKADVIRLARDNSIAGTYSCHSGRTKPCGKCISCAELTRAKAATTGGP